MDSNWSLPNLKIEPSRAMNTLSDNPPLSRQQSMYSLTTDQIQNNLVKDCGLVNMDGLAKNICNAKETQALVFEGLQRKCSVTLSPTSSQKTVDEFWKHIKEKEEHAKIYNKGGGRGRNIPQIQRQQILGDITMKKFLDHEEAKEKYNNNVGYAHGSSSLVSSSPNTSFYDFKNNVVTSRNQVQQLHGSNLHSNVKESMLTYQRQLMLHGYGYGTKTGFSSSQVNTYGMRDGFMGMRDQSFQEKNINLVPSVDTSSLIKGRKNKSGMEMEKNKIEKARRRKIKNRESAMRSRARKHAQTLELEAEVEKLKKENQELLRKQEMINLQEQPERELRRTQSDIK